MRRRSTGHLLLAAVLLAGCGGGATTTSSDDDTIADAPADGPNDTGDVAADDPEDAATDAPAAEGPVVEAVDDGFRFTPGDLEVDVGATVTWVNTGQAQHNVLGGPLRSGTLGAGETFAFTFEEAGEVTYACYFHTGMQGTVRVLG